MNFELNAFFSFTVGIGAIIGWVKIKKIDPAFFPFLILLLTGFVHEVISWVIVHEGYSNAASYNCFTLLESILITWQFYKWGLFERMQRYYLLQLSFTVSWFGELWSRQNIHVFFSYFIVLYATVIVLMSIRLLGRVMFREPGNILLQTEFLVCMGLTLYFTYTILIEVFWLYGLNKSVAFRLGIYEVFGYINLFTNLVFAFAAIWIPLKRRYILQSL